MLPSAIYSCTTFCAVLILMCISQKHRINQLSVSALRPGGCGFNFRPGQTKDLEKCCPLPPSLAPSIWGWDWTWRITL